MPRNANVLSDLVRAKIESLRPKLLDLSRRNPLIATKLGPRSNSHIRAVDELPDVLFYKLNNNQQMQLIPLPPVEEDPRDEQTDAFREALTNARITDDIYLSAMEAIDKDADDYLDKSREAERALKDRVREILGLPTRVQKNAVNLVQHARNNGILPSYELPEADDEHEDGRHTDDNIQTLLLPADLERKLNSIISKCRTWIQETGINVLHIAFGFLEWNDGVQAENSFAPLVLLEAQIKKVPTSEGAKYYIIGLGEEIQTNAVLLEKLRIQFNIELPVFDGSSIEDYLREVARKLPKKLQWRVRRQVAMGVFPSARMAMYHDLDPSQKAITESAIVESLLVGSAETGALPFADEYEVDKPNIEAKVPCLVMDADSSQFSALVDISDGKNVAIEGPPGTGKSQTIVNAIAAALGAGKTVLFIAEKLAALNVVKSRLEAVGLGEFLLPLQAEKSTREQVMDSIRDRLEITDTRAVRDYDDKVQQFKRVRQQLAKYIDLITSKLRDTDLTVHEVLGKSILSKARLESVPKATLEKAKPGPEFLSKSGLTALRVIGDQLTKSHRDSAVAGPHWQDTRLLNPNRFTVDDACELAASAAAELRALSEACDALSAVGLKADTPVTSLVIVERHLSIANDLTGQLSRETLIALLDSSNLSSLRAFAESCRAFVSEDEDLRTLIAIEPDTEALGLLSHLAAICNEAGIESANIEKLEAQLQKSKAAAKTSRAVSAAIDPLILAFPDSRNWRLADLAKAKSLLKKVGRDALRLRSAARAEQDASFHLRAFCEEARTLQSQKAKLDERVSFTNMPSLEQLKDSASIFRTAGFLSAFTGSYRNAKRLFQSLSRTPKFSKAAALQTLNELVEFQQNDAGFESRCRASRLFDPHFRGLGTDFGLFEEIANFYESLESELYGPDSATLRGFLREAQLAQLDLIPNLPATDLLISYDGLQTRIHEADAEARSWEHAIGRLRECAHVVSNIDTSVEELRRLAGRLEVHLKDKSALESHAIARKVLNQNFNAHRTDLSILEECIAWADGAKDHAILVGPILIADNASQAVELLGVVRRSDKNIRLLLEKLSDVAKVETATFSAGKSLLETADGLEAAASDGDGLFAHATFATSLQDVQPHGIAPIVTSCLERNNSLEGLGELCEALVVDQLARQIYADMGTQLTRFTGSKLDDLRADLAAQDKEIIRLSRQQLRARVKQTAKPPSGNGIGRKSTWTEMALIENEIAKKQRYIAVRDLTHRAGKALMQIKPCWMMSPLAVAQYVPKGLVKFDLCIIDEASQMPPESAIGALLRADQVVVVGDTNQLPPSSFFRTMVDDEDADEDESVLDESVLEMANATFRPARRLRWHYRSRHSGLIKFSNRLVYDDNLVVFPSANESMSRMGVEFRGIKGRYKAGTNPIEAKAVVEAAIEFMHNDPDRSLGIVTLNQKQRELIKEEFDYAIANDRRVQKYIEAWDEKNDGLEEFFIKNLENVQGDERDVIFIGTVYGPEELGGRTMQRFGPINGIAGKRRLNVLFSRAKEKIVTFSSMTASDIEAEANGNVGAYMLKRWLEYSASGVLDAGEETLREPDSDFEVFVIDQIKAMGCIPIPQVGVAGYFVDIGVRHPEWPHGFILGVECDGATYHSAKSARDRDRLRQEVLEGLGWQLHRIWSTDWFNSPQREAERLRKVITERMATLKARASEFAPRPTRTEPEVKVKEVTPTQTNLAFSNDREPERPPATKAQVAATGVSVGDTVRVRYLTDDKRTVNITISKAATNIAKGIVNEKSPMAEALLGAEKGDEVEVLIGSYIRSAIIEQVSKHST
jgi:transcription elongation GreA/GreB family factor